MASDISDPTEISISAITSTNVIPIAATTVADACNRILLRLLTVRNGLDMLANTMTANSITTIEYR
jgi:hypothetical protein